MTRLISKRLAKCNNMVPLNPFKNGSNVSRFLLLRLVEEIRQKCGGLQLQNEDVYMATKFGDFIQKVVRKLRGEDQEVELVVDYVSFSMLPEIYIIKTRKL